MTKTLYTCGDSFMSCDFPDNGTTSFLDRFAKAKGYDHINIAKSGSTNFCIRMQVDHAIQNNAGFVIVGATTSDRVDIPKPTERKKQSVGRVREFFNDLRRWHQVLWPTNKMFNQAVGLRTIEYRGYGCRSERTIQNLSVTGDEWATTISDSINNFVTDLAKNNIHRNNERDIPDELRKVIEDYVLWMHDESYAQQRDYWLIQSALYSLDRAGIPYVFIPGPLSKFDWGDHTIVWPVNSPQPWDKPDGFNEDSVTHLYNSGHEKICQTLIDITPTWK